MQYVYSHLYPGDVVKSSGNHVLRKMQTNRIAEVPDLDVFFDFKIVGNNKFTGNKKTLTLANQGTDPAVSFASNIGATYGVLETIRGLGLKASSQTTAVISFTSAGFNLLGVADDLAAGPKTIAFRISDATPITGNNAKNAQILTPNSSNYASFGVGASTAEQAYHAYARWVGSSDFALARSLDLNWSINGSHFAWFGAINNINDKNVIITAGSEAEPSPVKIYIDGALVAAFDFEAAPVNYLDLRSTDGIIRCFKSAKTGTSTQDWAKYTMSYFGMTRGEMDADEVKKLNRQLSLIA